MMKELGVSVGLYRVYSVVLVVMMEAYRSQIFEYQISPFICLDHLGFQINGNS